MSRNFKNSTVSLRSGEIAGGFLYLPFYLVLTSLIVSYVCAALSVPMDSYRLNVAVFVVDFIAVVAIFHRFLFDSLRIAGRNFWLFVQAVILAVVFYFAMAYAVNFVYAALHLSVTNGNNDDVLTMVRAHFAPMLVCTCVLAPVVEETLCRGLLFGTVHKKNRIAAYAVSMLAFAVLHVWQYAIADGYSLANILLVTVAYLPAGVALGWAYEKSGTIWAAILTHALINFITCYASISL